MTSHENSEPLPAGKPYSPEAANAQIIQDVRTLNARLHAHDGLDPAASFILSGGCYRTVLDMYNQAMGPNEYDTHLAAARDHYMALMLTKPHFWNRLSRKAQLAQATEAYAGSFVAKMMAYVDAESADAVLETRQMPSITHNTHFHDTEPIHKEDFVANHLYLLMDAALQEHAARRKIIDEHQRGTIGRRIATNRPLRIGLAVGMFAAASMPELRGLPIDGSYLPDEALTNYIEFGIKVGSAAIFGIEAPEIIRLGVLQRRNDKRTKELEEQLAASPSLTDLALRLVYGSVRYGDNPATFQMRNRHGTDDADENLRRLRSLDTSFDGLHHDPGGKPYRASQALGYAARLLVEREDQVDAIVDPDTSGEDKRSQYAALVKDILLEDLERMKQGLTITRARKEIMKMLGFIPALIFSQELSIASDAVTFARDGVKTALGDSHRSETETEF